MVIIERKTTIALLKNPRVLVGGILLLSLFLLALAAPNIAPFDPFEQELSRKLLTPGWEHPFGCDLNGRDLLTIMLHGARTSLYIAFVTVFLSVGLGSLLGLFSGYFRGYFDAVMMRIVDIVMAVPGVLVALVLASFLGSGANNVVIAIAATGWTSSARIVRGQVMSLRERDYVLASKALGASPWRLIFIHIFPGTLTPMIVHATFSLSGVILVESSLSFLGLGSQSEAPTWGALLNQGRNVLEQAPFLSVIPGVAIMALVLSLNFLGDGLRDVLDPRKSRL